MPIGVTGHQFIQSTSGISDPKEEYAALDKMRLQLEKDLQKCSPDQKEAICKKLAETLIGMLKLSKEAGTDPDGVNMEDFKSSMIALEKASQDAAKAQDIFDHMPETTQDEKVAKQIYEDKTLTPLLDKKDTIFHHLRDILPNPPRSDIFIDDDVKKAVTQLCRQ